MTLASDILDRAEHLAQKRQPWEKVWLDTVRFALPMGERFFSSQARRAAVDAFARGPRAEERGREIFDATSVWSVDRLTAGLESLTTPAAEKWHGLGTLDPLAPEPSDAELEWFDRYRDFLFAARYEARSGFALANQQAIRSAVALGTGIYLVEEAFDDRAGTGAAMPFRYRPIPLSECFIATDSTGAPDTLYRRFSMTARQMVQKFGGRVAARVKTAADNPKDKDRLFEIVHAVFPREERGARGGRASQAPDAAFSSVYVDADHRHLIGESGFFEFPYVIYYWQQDPETGYGESPVMLALAEIKSLNLLSKHTLRAAQQWTNPPIAIPNDGVVRRPNLNPGAVNVGAIDEEARPRIVPLVTAQNPTFVQQVLEVKREQLRESLFVNLFQILLQNPQMTATEALIRANEKGELLGPAGAKIQAGLSRLVERETGILERKGVFEGGGPLSPPDSLLGRGFGVRFRAPLDRLRRAGELLGVQQTFAFAGQIAQFDPTVLDRLDTDKALDLAQEINGAPRVIFRRDEEVEQLRAERDELAPAQAALAAAAEMAGGEGTGQLTETGIEGVENANAILEQLGLGAAGGTEAGPPLGPDADPGLPQPV